MIAKTSTQRPFDSPIDILTNDFFEGLRREWESFNQEIETRITEKKVTSKRKLERDFDDDFLNSKKVNLTDNESEESSTEEQELDEDHLEEEVEEKPEPPLRYIKIRRIGEADHELTEGEKVLEAEKLKKLERRREFRQKNFEAIRKWTDRIGSHQNLNMAVRSARIASENEVYDERIDELIATVELNQAKFRAALKTRDEMIENKSLDPEDPEGRFGKVNADKMLEWIRRSAITVHIIRDKRDLIKKGFTNSGQSVRQGYYSLKNYYHLPRHCDLYKDFLSEDTD